MLADVDALRKLRDIWLDITASPKSFFTPADPLAAPEQSAPQADDVDPEEPASPPRPALSPSAVTTSFLPNPFSSFVPSKASPTLPSMIKARGQGFGYAPDDATTVPCRLDVLPWLARATLDVIGEAGFGYAFNALEAAAEAKKASAAAGAAAGAGTGGGGGAAAAGGGGGGGAGGGGAGATTTTGKKKKAAAAAAAAATAAWRYRANISKR